MRRLLVTSIGALTLAVACGGVAVIDAGSGAGGSGGGSSSSSSGSSTSTNTNTSTSTGTGSVDCDQLLTEYARQLEIAKTCIDDITFEQCTRVVDSSLACPCDTSVNPSNTEAVDALRSLSEAYRSANCTLPPCPPVECVELQGAGCNMSSCVDYGPD